MHPLGTSQWSLSEPSWTHSLANPLWGTCGMVCPFLVSDHLTSCSILTNTCTIDLFLLYSGTAAPIVPFKSQVERDRVREEKKHFQALKSGAKHHRGPAEAFRGTESSTIGSRGHGDHLRLPKRGSRRSGRSASYSGLPFQTRPFLLFLSSTVFLVTLAVQPAHSGAAGVTNLYLQLNWLIWDCGLWSCGYLVQLLGRSA